MASALSSWYGLVPSSDCYYLLFYSARTSWVQASTLLLRVPRRTLSFQGIWIWMRIQKWLQSSPWGRRILEVIWPSQNLTSSSLNPVIYPRFLIAQVAQSSRLLTRSSKCLGHARVQSPWAGTRVALDVSICVEGTGSKKSRHLTCVFSGWVSIPETRDLSDTVAESRICPFRLCFWAYEL